ncbi:hypothetical protein M758_3G045400 [Ceratodon purpureus]|nr:hypothetical protein M758_3G045400 [Ceratodon purpureus]
MRRTNVTTSDAQLTSNSSPTQLTSDSPLPLPSNQNPAKPEHNHPSQQPGQLLRSQVQSLLKRKASHDSSWCPDFNLQLPPLTPLVLYTGKHPPSLAPQLQKVIFTATLASSHHSSTHLNAPRME